MTIWHILFFFSNNYNKSTMIQLLITATSSGCGKTTFTLGLLRALKRRGLSIASFKVGPDYIDPKFHELASGQKSINLDLYMMSKAHIQDTYQHYSQGKDVAITEGVMGLFDGSVKMRGSSAELAQTLDLPIILLVNAASSAYSVGAMIYGFANWQKNIKVAGVVFNRVASESHYRFLADAAEDAGIAALGYIPRHKGLDVPSRHLGLSLEELNKLDYFPNEVADLLEEHLDIERLLQLCTKELKPRVQEVQEQEPSKNPIRIAVASDEAFNFIYPENIKALERLGEVSLFSPLRDKTLPEANLVYFAGGYPEFYLEQLSSNETMRESVRNYVEANGKVLAECGGMMYLTQAIINEEGESYPMCGVLDNQATLEQMKLSLGYRSLKLQNGLELRGHEFHYSKLKDEVKETTIAQQFNAKGIEVPTALMRYKNVIAGYTHLYWAETDILKLWE